VVIAAIMLPLLLAGACTGPADPIEVPLAVLSLEAHRFDGRRVATTGIVRRIDQPLHYWLETDVIYRVQLLPASRAEPYLGRPVRVVGTFSTGPRTGRRLHIDNIEPR
jgi:hypothetical protein